MDVNNDEQVGRAHQSVYLSNASHTIELMNRIKFALAIFLPILSGIILKAQPKLANQKDPPISKFERSRYAIPYKTFVLDNGLTVIVNEDHNVPIVGVNFWYHVGSKNEVRGKTGFAHLFEHFFFNGSENYPHGFREAMDNLGANNRNGTTNADRTNFFEDVPTSALDRTLYLEADRMGFLSLSKEMLERERGVVQNEKRQGENQPYGKMNIESIGKIYPYAHPYSWTTIGSMEDLNAATLDDVKNWYKTYYGPNNVVLSLSGDITVDQAKQLVKKYFDGIAPLPPLARAQSWVPVLDHNIRAQMQDRVPQTAIWRVYHVPAWKSHELEYIRLFANVISGSKSAPLDKRLIYEKQLATSVDVTVDDQELSSLFYIFVTVKEGVDPTMAEKEMDSVINMVLKRGPSAEELERAKTRILGNFSRSIERLGGMGGRSDILAESMTFGGSPDVYLDKLELMSNAKPADVKSIAQKWLLASSFTMVVDPYPTLTAGKTDIDRSVLPELETAPDIIFPKIQQATLRNGLKVMLIERNTIPIVDITMAVDAGFSSDTRAKAGMASLALDLMDKGTKTKNAFQISDQLDMLGAELNTRSDIDISFVQLKALTENLTPSLQLFSDIILNPSFPEDQFKIQKDQRLADIDQEKSTPNSIVFRVAPQINFGADHPYGMPESGSGYEQTVKSITRADLQSWHQNWFRPGNATLIIAGNTSMEKLLPALESAFSQWKPGKGPDKNISAVTSSKGGKIYLIDQPGALQSTIVATHVSEAGGQPEDVAIETVLTNFGGMATSRLNRNLRLDKHWSYGTSGGLRSARGQRAFMVIAPVQTDKTKESMVEIEKEIRGVAGDRLLEGEEYASIMRNMTMRLPARFSTLQSLENAAARIYNYGLPIDYWSNYANRVRSLTESQLNAAAKKFIHPNQINWIVVGDLSKVEKGIAELNYGELIRLDADGKPLKN
jgi:zinc protease